MEDKACVVSVAFRAMYVKHSKRQEEFIRHQNPSLDLIYFRDKLPMKDRIEENDVVGNFQKSLYGFKPHAIQRAIDAGYTKIIWLDPSVYPTCNMNVLINSLDKNPMIVRTGDQSIVGMVNKNALDWFGLSEDQLGSTNHIGGTFYAFNLNDTKVRAAFFLWKEAEEAGIFGDQDAFMKGHWADEACMTLALYRMGIKQYYEKEFTYLNQKDFESTI